MIIQTASWGELDIAEEQIYRFPKGMPGFEEETEFALISLEDGPLDYLQSTKEPGFAFLLGDPFVYFPQYEFELPEADTEELDIQSQVVIRCIISLKEQIYQSTMNLLAPVVLNPEKNLGKQVVLHHSSYQTRHPLWSESGSKPSAKAGE